MPKYFATQSSHPGPHVAIIMDGNGRWATQRNLRRTDGHRAGMWAARRTVEHAPEVGIRCLTLYAFSSDNWRRPLAEVQAIFWLLRAFLRLECMRMVQAGVRVQMIGRRDRIPARLLRVIEETERATEHGQRLRLRVAIDYSSRDAIVRAARSATGDTTDASRSALTHELTCDSGDVDLLIRTGGEKRLSDFLLWESAYAELFFTDRMWPDFDESDLDAALHDFHRRDRRFGAAPTPTSHPPFPIQEAEP
jgi:undecaprenyl diphosphate synthase